MSLKLERLQRAVSIVDANGLPSSQFQLFWQKTAKALEDADVDIRELIQAIADILGIADDLAAATQAAQDAADSANAAAAAAQGAADEAASNSSLASSGTSGLTITATDVGSSVTISISSHTRIYGDGTSAAVSGGVITGLAYSTGYYLYYEDPDRLGGSVTFLATMNQADAAQIDGTHSLGAVTTPAAAAPPNDGRPNLPPGVQEP